MSFCKHREGNRRCYEKEGHVTRHVMVADTGGAAFPIVRPGEGEGGRSLWQSGMTLRDWFAGKIAASIAGADDGCAITVTQAKEKGIRPIQALARTAYDIADALIEERSRQEESTLEVVQ